MSLDLGELVLLEIYCDLGLLVLYAPKLGG